MHPTALNLAQEYELSPLHPITIALSELYEQVEDLKKQLGRPFVMERGEWSAADDGSYVMSEDFTHDVLLRITGDFFDTQQRKEYAEELARRLNNKDSV